MITPFRAAMDLALGVGSTVTRSSQTVLGDDAVCLSPEELRNLMLTFESSIRGRLLHIFGDNEAERVDTLVRLLQGSTSEDLNELARITQQAVVRLHQAGQ